MHNVIVRTINDIPSWKRISSIKQQIKNQFAVNDNENMLQQLSDQLETEKQLQIERNNLSRLNNQSDASDDNRDKDEEEKSESSGESDNEHNGNDNNDDDNNDDDNND